MGSGSSAKPKPEAPLSKAETQDLAGDKFDEKKFDELAVDGMLPVEAWEKAVAEAGGAEAPAPTPEAAPSKKGYVYGFFDMKDMKEFKEVYSPMAEPTLEPYGGKFIMKHALVPEMAAKMGMKETKTFGTTGQMAFMLEFESFEKAMGWFTGPEYAGVIGKRDEVADFKMAVVEGAPITPGAGLVVGFFDMKDMKEFKEVYSPMAEPTLDPYGGKFALKHALVPEMAAKMGMKETKTFGTTGQMAFVLAFADFDKAMGWFTGPEYAGVIGKRDEVADFKMAVVQTMAPAPAPAEEKKEDAPPAEEKKEDAPPAEEKKE